MSLFDRVLSRLLITHWLSLRIAIHRTIWEGLEADLLNELSGASNKPPVTQIRVVDGNTLSRPEINTLLRLWDLSLRKRTRNK